MNTELSREERARYSRHLILPEVGLEGQLKLKAAKVLLVGAGGLGSPSALYLAASGIGEIGIVDFDAVDLTNLHRQVLHGTSDIGRSKLDSAAETLADINPNVSVRKHEGMLTRENAMEIIGLYDLVVDGTDNFQTRYLVNDACVLSGKPNIYGSIFRFDGQASVFCTPGGPCYRCLYPEPPPPGVVPSCAEGGVLGVLPGIIGLIQATEAVKIILGVGQSLVGRLLLYDALGMSFQEVRIKRDPACPVCGDNPSIRELVDYDQFCGITKPMQLSEIDAGTLGQWLAEGSCVLVDVREPSEYEVDRIEGSKLIPLGQLEGRLSELDPSKRTVLQCKSGGRSARACALLSAHGFKDVHNLQGGILGWIAARG